MTSLMRRQLERRGELRRSATAKAPRASAGGGIELVARQTGSQKEPLVLGRMASAASRTRSRTGYTILISSAARNAAVPRVFETREGFSNMALRSEHPNWPSFHALQKGAARQARPDERLAELRSDMREAKARVRQVLEALADKYGIAAKDVSYAIDGYADDMLSDLVFGIERDLENEADSDLPLSPKSS